MTPHHGPHRCWTTPWKQSAWWRSHESLASELLQWIEQTIVTLNDRQLANSLSGVQNQLQSFNSYRTVEKPPK